MDPERLRGLLEAVGAGTVNVEAALQQLRRLPFDDIGYAHVDHHRALRQGVPEVILGVSLLILFVTLGIKLGYTTIVISHVTFCFPFVMAAVQARLSGLDPALEEAALDLGATPAQAFTKVLVPYLMPAIVSGALMSFTLSLDELIVTYFTASAGTRTLPLEIFGRVKKGLDPSLNAISTVFILVTVLAVVLTEALRRRNP